MLAPPCLAWLLLGLMASACVESMAGGAGHRRDSAHVAPGPTPGASQGASGAGAAVSAEPCAADERVTVFEDGAAAAVLCPDQARERGLTIIDLSDDWAPYPLTADPALGDAGVPPYLATFRALARGDFDQLSPVQVQARSDYFFELYGIPPTLSRLRERILDAKRHDCHARIDDSPLARLTGPLRLESADGGRDRPILAVQQRLACERLLDLRKAPLGRYDWRTAEGVAATQRQHMIVPDRIVGEEMREVFRTSSQEHDLRAALRVLRERVVDATGLIEDGSAVEAWGTVLGRYIDGAAFRRPTGQDVPADGAPDLISPATEAAARALGWTSFAALRTFMTTHMAAGEVRLRVAVRLPPLPAYHGPEMALHAIIDRGDVSYERPADHAGGCASKPVERRPTLTLYAIDGERRIALVRWFTTIGGWNREKLPGGEIALRYKGSAVGRRYWRDLIAAPAWLPPASTPDDELVRVAEGGDVSLRHDTFGPGYRSAYGLVMLVHHQLVQRNGRDVYVDKNIRTHGSYAVSSILHGCSHGCHRLFNHQALRLASFLLKHRRHVRRGPVAASYSRRVTVGDTTLRLRLGERGYRYELTPPVAVDVTPGRVQPRPRRSGREEP